VSSQPKELAAFLPVGPGSESAGQSGDLQGLSNVEGADSESVDELLEEGNSFEAEVIAGVEDAGDSEKEVHTHEVPEDDVPGEYLDKTDVITIDVEAGIRDLSPDFRLSARP